MALKFRIELVQLVTAAATYDYNFDRRCTVLEGPVGTGKSSLLELIKYALGGNATLTPVIRSEVREVQVRARFGDSRVVLSRRIGVGADVVNVLDPSDLSLIVTVTVRPKSELQSVSDYLLELVRFPAVRIPRSRSRSTSANVPLSFADVYSYVYVEQQGIDRSIVHHTEVFREPKRRAVFELMFGLATSEALRLETQLGQIKDELKSLIANRNQIQTFLDSARVEPRIELERRVAECTRAVEESLAGLAALRADIANNTRAHDQLRQSVRAVEQARDEAVRAAHDAELEVERRSELVAQQNIEIIREDRMTSASRRIGPLEFVICPRCLQDIEFGRTDEAHCSLCVQPLPASEGSLDSVAGGDEILDDPTDFLEEQEKLLDESREALALRLVQLEAATAEADRARAALDRVTQEVVSPKFDEIEFLSTRRGDAAARGQVAREKLTLWDELDQVQEAVEAMALQQAEVQNNLNEERDRLASRAQVIADLSEQLNETVRDLRVPWANSARLDESTFLPLINDERFEGLAVAGGTKTVVTVAYHLTLMAYALPRNDCLLPGLLVMDTPRKNLGSNPQDSEMGDRIYRRIRALVDLYGDAVQFIIADNDVPSGSDWFETIHFDYDLPLLPHVLHPGEEAAVSGQLERVGVDPVRR